jgi:hypothetical protein
MILISDSLQLLIAHKLMIFFDFITIDKSVFLLKSACKKRNENWPSLTAEESQLSMGSTRVFLDLFPQKEVMFQLFPTWRMLVYN